MLTERVNVMIQIFHEAPKSIFKQVQAVTDGDYALVNLFDEDPDYYHLFRNAVLQGRTVILDNGVFELGTAWDAEHFADWVRKLQPTYYIVPDVLEDADATIKSFFNFMDKYASGLPGKIIGVVQGKNFDDYVRCYKAIAPYCDRIGISFDCSWYKEGIKSDNPWVQQAGGRLRMLIRMDEMDVINHYKQHHLLGVSLPQEMEHYRLFQESGGFNWITSVDTSNPVVHGLKGIAYTSDGLQSKETQKLYTLVNSWVDADQFDTIMHNIKQFRRFCNG